MIDTSRDTHAGQLVPVASSPQVSSNTGTELVSLANKPIHEKKAHVYAEVVKKLNSSRERGLPFKVWSSCTSKCEYAFCLIIAAEEYAFFLIAFRRPVRFSKNSVQASPFDDDYLCCSIIVN